MGCSNICVGDMRQVAQVIAPRWEDTEYGGSTNQYVQKGQMYCMVQETSGSETEHRQRLEGRRTVKFITRYRNDLRQDDELVFECFRHNIIQINDLDRRHRWLEITTERGQHIHEKIDIVNELYLLTFDGEEMVDHANEAIVEGFNLPMSNTDDFNYKTFDDETLVTHEADNCGV